MRARNHNRQNTYNVLRSRVRWDTLQVQQILQFEWDTAKAEANLIKHAVGFDEARSVFLDPLALVIEDPDHSTHEERFVILGFSKSLRLLIVSHCLRASGSVIRIISARRATSREAATYEHRSDG